MTKGDLAWMLAIFSPLIASGVLLLVLIYLEIKRYFKFREKSISLMAQRQVELEIEDVKIEASWASPKRDDQEEGA